MKKRRHLTLLEVLISLTIVVLCALPLVAPHVGIYREQKELTRMMERDRQVQNWFAGYYEDLLLGKAALPEEPQEAFEGVFYKVKADDMKTGKEENAQLILLTLTAGRQEYIYKIAAKYEKETTDSNTP